MFLHEYSCYVRFLKKVKVKSGSSRCHLRDMSMIRFYVLCQKFNILVTESDKLKEKEK